MKIEVTQEHIDKGVRQDCYACPISLALISQGFTDVSVGDTTMTVRVKKGHRFRLFTSCEAGDFIKSFDNRLPVAPFSFEFPISPYEEVTE